MKSLNEVAKELNTVMGLEPPIKTVGVKKETLLEKVKEAAEYIDPEQDEFTDETQEALRELGLWPGKEEETVEEKPKPKASKVKPEPEKPNHCVINKARNNLIILYFSHPIRWTFTNRHHAWNAQLQNSWRP